MMDIQKLESLLEMLSSVGVEQVKISPTEDGSFISGAGSSGKSTVLTQMEKIYNADKHIQHTLNDYTDYIREVTCVAYICVCIFVHDMLIY